NTTRLLKMTCITDNDACRDFTPAITPSWWCLMSILIIACWGWNAQAAVTFATVVTYPVNANPYWIALGDFNSDGNLHISVTNSVSHNVSILLGNGNGIFQSAANFTTGNAPQ